MPPFHPKARAPWRAPSPALAAPLLALALGAVALPARPLAAQPPAAPSATADDAPPPVARELRAVWIVTVANGDWPSRPGLDSDAQQRELIAILDRAAALGLNAVVLQIRPGADALYASKYEPWSNVLSGRQGRAPKPYYDPLAFAVKAAHDRGLELHAWFNPYRVIVPRDSGPAKNNLLRTHPRLVRRYGSYLWMDPGLSESRERAIRVITDVVRRYDVDAVHIDDYFYPYRETRNGREIPFPDQRTYRAYRKRGGRLSLADWRRRNIDTFVHEFYTATKRTKPWVKVGISPFGIWRPGSPPEVSGMDAYAEIYADARKWLREGWLDYIAPQLYWRPDSPQQPYAPLLEWWVSQNVRGRNVWPGLFTGHVAMSGSAKWSSSEILREIDLTRQTEGATGHIHFPMKTLLSDPDSLTTKLADAYAEPALVPASPWLDRTPPARPKLVVARDTVSGAVTVAITPPKGEVIRHWVVQTRRAGTWHTELLPGWVRRQRVATLGDSSDVVQVRGIDRVGNESAPATLSLLPPTRIRKDALPGGGRL